MTFFIRASGRMEVKMQPTLCSRCKKNVAVVFISKLDGDRTINEGLCLKCAKDLGLPWDCPRWTT